MKQYNHKDLERYWKGLLNAEEARELEKAALEDPFLAEALEGYRHSADSPKEIRMLGSRLDRRTRGSYSLPWMRIAAMIIILAGLGFLILEYLPGSKGNEISAVEKVQEQEMAPPARDTSRSADAESIQPSPSPEPEIKTKIKNSGQLVSPIEKDAASDTPEQSIKEQDIVSSPAANNPVNQPFSATMKKEDMKDSVTRDLNESVTANAGRKRAAILTNSFKGKIVDHNNLPVPFANIVNPLDMVGTYTDKDGEFSMVSTQDKLHLEIRALGFGILRKDFIPGRSQVLMLSPTDSLRNLKPLNENWNLALARGYVASENEDEEEELSVPVIGWNDYNIYLENNLFKKQELKGSLARVELSFQVNENGRPTRIRVTKSSNCRSCDQEAIRALRDGPGWTGKGRRKLEIKIEPGL